MATKSFKNVRFQFKYDSLDNWNKNNPILKLGEIAIAYIESTETNQPQVLFKVGNNSSNFKNLPYVSAKAADVFSWAKAGTKPTYTADEIDGLTAFIQAFITNAGISLDTDTQYRIVQDTTNKNKFTLESKAKGDSTFAKVNEITIPAYDDKEVRDLIGSVNNVVNGVSTVANNAMGEVSAIKMGTTVVPKAEQATKDGGGKVIADTYALQKDVSANTEAIEVLKGDESTDGSVLNTVRTEINSWANNISDDKTINTFKELIDYAAEHGEEFTELVGEVEHIKDGTTTVPKAEQATKDAKGNVIDTTYAKDSEYQGTKTIASLNMNAVSSIISGDQIVGKAEKDSQGKVIKDWYATKEYAEATAGSLVSVAERVGKIENGTTTVPKATNATNDEDGKQIKTTYAKNDDLEAIAKTGNVNDLVQTTGDVIIFECGDSTNC